MPRWAREISPGNALAPPPMMAVVLAVWCGERKGRAIGTSESACVSPWSLAISICSSGEGGGRRFWATLASMVLPEPGGPENRRLWLPAMAMISARLARACPWMWSKRQED